MATDAENLLTRRTAILAELAALDSTKAGGKPNTTGGGDKVSIDHVGYRKSLYEELAMINSTLTAIQGSVINETLYEV
jgi:hypothetical protein